MSHYNTIHIHQTKRYSCKYCCNFTTYDIKEIQKHICQEKQEMMEFKKEEVTK